MWILSPLLLFKLLVKASASAKHEIISKSKASKHWLCWSQISGWYSAPVVSFPLRSALPAQSCLQALFAEGTWRKTQKASLQEHSCWKKPVLRSASDWDIREEGNHWWNLLNLVYLRETFSSTKSSSPEAEDSQIWLSHPPCQSILLPPQPQDPCCALCPHLSWEPSMHLSSAKAGLQAE